ncbi:MAG: hypothetical protein IPH35_18335 [Rhodoferax sp.]|nr:hypothetical protein [Rhodoferax sp.]
MISLGALLFILVDALAPGATAAASGCRLQQLIHGRLESPIEAIRQRTRSDRWPQSMEETRIALRKLFGEIEQRNAELEMPILEQRVAERTQSLTRHWPR